MTKEVSKEVLLQYIDLKKEIEDLRDRIKKLEEQISKVESEGAVYDTVKGGEGGIRPYRIEGFPYPEYSRKKTLLYARKDKLKSLEEDIDIMINEVENYISSINDSRIRQIIRYRYIDNLTWTKVASKFGRSCTADSIRMEFSRFMSNN